MSTTTSTTVTARRRSPGDRRTTRRRIVETAVRLLQEEGAAAVSTTRLTSEVGIVQSGFYSHFPSVDDCLAEAAALVVEQVRGPVRDWMEELRSSAPDGDDLVLEQLTVHFVRVLEALVPRWPIFELVERYRRSASTFGTALASAHGEVVADVRTYLAAVFKQAGLPGRRHARRLDLLASLIVDLVLSATEQAHRDPKLDRRMTAEVLALATHHAVAGSMTAIQQQAASAR